MIVLLNGINNSHMAGGNSHIKASTDAICGSFLKKLKFLTIMFSVRAVECVRYSHLITGEGFVYTLPSC